MPVDNAVRTAAMDVVLTWGPERMRPEIDRLRDSFPGIDDGSAKRALAEASRVLREAEDGAAVAKSSGVHQLENALRKDRPWLTSDQAGRAVSQGMYYHWRETGM